MLRGSCNVPILKSALSTITNFFVRQVESEAQLLYQDESLLEIGRDSLPHPIFTRTSLSNMTLYLHISSKCDPNRFRSWDSRATTVQK